MAEDKKVTSKYSIKRKNGCEINHKRHPKIGIPWCSLCNKQGGN